MGSPPAHGRTGGGEHASYGWGCASGRFICATDLTELVSCDVCGLGWETFVCHENEPNWRSALQNAVATSTQSGATQSMLPHTAGDMLVVDFFAPETLLTSYRAMSAEQSR